jgi:hemoglobin
MEIKNNNKSQQNIYIPLPGPPQVAPPSKEIYSLMGEKNIFTMIKNFYFELGKSKISFMFPNDLEKSSENSAAFFIGLFGGPPIYQEKYGPPRMRQRHFDFPIDERARLEWIRCFETVLADAPSKYNFPSKHIEGFKTFLREFSKWMVNTEPQIQSEINSLRK